MKFNSKLKATLHVFVILLMPKNIIAHKMEIKNEEKLQQQAKDQTEEIDLIVELLAEAATKRKFNKNFKNASPVRLENMRKSITLIRKGSCLSLPQLIGTHEFIIGSLEVMTNNDFKIIPNIVPNQITRGTKRYLTPHEIQDKLDQNEKKLERIHQKFNLMGLSALNIITRKCEIYIKKLNLHKATKRLVPYAFIALYLVYVNNKDKIYVPQTLDTFFNTIKAFLNKSSSVIKDNNSNPIPPDKPSATDSNTPQDTITEVTSLPELLQSNNLFAMEYGPIIKLAPAAILYEFIKQDVVDITKSVYSTISVLYAKLKNEVPEKHLLFSKPTFNPNSLNLMEILEFKNIKNYFKYNNLFDLAEHKIDKYILLRGSQITGSYMADILCAQLSKELRKDSRIVYLNGSDFVPPKKLTESTFDKADKLPKILKNSKKHDICIIVIKDMDWIYEQQERTIGRLDTFLDDIAKKPNIILIALTDKASKTYFRSNTLLTELTIPDLTYEQRVSFIKAQLWPNHTTQQNIDVTTIAQQTENCTLADLKKIIQDAYTLSFTEHKPLNTKHLADSLSKMTRNRKN